MTRLLLIILLTQGHMVMSQSISSFSKIVCRYDKGHYSFEQPGQYAQSETIEYTKSRNSSFQITQYNQLKKSYDTLSKINHTDTIVLSLPGKKISQTTLENLLKELNTSKDNFNIDYVKRFLKKITKKEILTIAKRYKLDWKFKNDVSDAEDRRIAFRQIKRLDGFEFFLSAKKPNPEFEIAYTDVWHSLSITCIGETDTIEYRCDFVESPGQPVKRYDNNNYSRSKKNINLEINNSIKKIVPANSLTRKAVDLNSLKEQYIVWYLQSRM